MLLLTIRDICASFDIDGKYVSCREIASGNINRTNKVKFIRNGEQKEYVLQRINKDVFKELIVIVILYPGVFLDSCFCSFNCV